MGLEEGTSTVVLGLVHNMIQFPARLQVRHGSLIFSARNLTRATASIDDSRTVSLL